MSQMPPLMDERGLFHLGLVHLKSNKSRPWKSGVDSFKPHSLEEQKPDIKTPLIEERGEFFRYMVLN